MDDNNIIELNSKDFPPLLKEITDPPKKLFVKGEFPDFEKNKFLCVVGSRKMSAYGAEVCEKLILGLAGYPIVIVSGLALGIDAIAHKSALQAKLKTIAIPGSGLGDKVLYPSANRNLAKRILEEDGALVSEFENDFRPTVWSFPQRNRIMAGISNATLIIEAGLKSGTLITSKMATEYNRDVLAVPGSIFSQNSEGPHMLIRLGATPITSSKDILEALGFKTESEEDENSTKGRKDYSECSPDEMILINLLSNGMEKDELISKSEIGVSRASIAISMLEIRGFIKESSGEIYLT